MSEDATHTLWCLIEGESTVFSVMAPLNTNINDLKELIRGKGVYGALRGVDAKDLILFKVRLFQSPYSECHRR
jgi:hypothetical protein